MAVGLVVDDARVEFEMPDGFSRFSAKEGESQWTDLSKPVGERAVMVLQTLDRSVGNTVDGVTQQMLESVHAREDSVVGDVRAGELEGMYTTLLSYAVPIGGRFMEFHYLVIDAPGPTVLAVGFVGPETWGDTMIEYRNTIMATVKPWQPEVDEEVASESPESPEAPGSDTEETVEGTGATGAPTVNEMLFTDYERNEFSGILEELQELRKQMPEDPTLAELEATCRMGLGIAAMKAGRIDEAILEMQAADGLSEPYSINTVLEELFTREAALMEEAEEDETVLPELLRIRGFLAIAHESHQDTENALAYWLAVTRFDETNEMAWERAGNLMLLSGWPMAAHLGARYYERAHELNPDDMPLANKFASSLMSIGDFVEARQLYEKLVEKSSALPNGDYIENLGILYAQLDENQRGLTRIAEWRSRTKDPRFTVVQAILLRGAGDREGAVALLDDAAASAAGDPLLSGYIRQLRERYERSQW